jgi:hypothetical protein
MTSAESDLVRCYHDGRTLHANIGLKRTKALCDYVLIGDCDKVVPLDIFKLTN